MTPLRKSIATRAIILASESGYRVNDEGNVLNPSGSKLSPWKDKRGYYRFSFVSPGDGIDNYKILVHQLAAYQHFGEIVLTEGVEVRHLNGNPGDNRKENLSFGDASQNEMDKTKEVRVRTAKKAAAARRKFSKDQIA
jgi:hypothetical protein